MQAGAGAAGVVDAVFAISEAVLPPHPHLHIGKHKAKDLGAPIYFSLLSSFVLAVSKYPISLHTPPNELR